MLGQEVLVLKQRLALVLMRYLVLQIKRAVACFIAFPFVAAAFVTCVNRPADFQLLGYPCLIDRTRIQYLLPSQRNTWHRIHIYFLVGLSEPRMQSL